MIVFSSFLNVEWIMNGIWEGGGSCWGLENAERVRNALGTFQGGKEDAAISRVCLWKEGKGASEVSLVSSPLLPVSLLEAVLNGTESISRYETLNWYASGLKKSLKRYLFLSYKWPESVLKLTLRCAVTFSGPLYQMYPWFLPYFQDFLAFWAWSSNHWSQWESFHWC